MQIYKITNLINQKIYIGKQKGNREDYYGSGKIIKRAINKYGKENFSKDIIVTCDNDDLLNWLEIFWIATYDSTNSDIGYNISSGGQGGDHNTGRKWSEEERNNHSIINIERPESHTNFSGRKHTELSKRKTSETLKKSPLSNKGKKLSDEQKEKLRLVKGLQK